MYVILMLRLDDLMRNPLPLVAVGAAWGVVGIYWFMMIAVVKFAIDHTMKSVSNPFGRDIPRSRSRAKLAAQ